MAAFDVQVQYDAAPGPEMPDNPPGTRERAFRALSTVLTTQTDTSAAVLGAVQQALTRRGIGWDQVRQLAILRRQEL